MIEDPFGAVVEDSPPATAADRIALFIGAFVAVGVALIAAVLVVLAITFLVVDHNFVAAIALGITAIATFAGICAASEA